LSVSPPNVCPGLLLPSVRTPSCCTPRGLTAKKNERRRSWKVSRCSVTLSSESMLSRSATVARIAVGLLSLATMPKQIAVGV
jgi:hypothetical protein